MGILPELRQFTVFCEYEIERNYSTVLVDQHSFCFSMNDKVHVALEFAVVTILGFYTT